MPFLDEDKYLEVLGDVLRPSYSARHTRAEKGRDKGKDKDRDKDRDGDGPRGEGEAVAAKSAEGAAVRAMDAGMGASDLLSMHGAFHHLSQRASIATGSAGRGSSRQDEAPRRRSDKGAAMLQQRVADWSLPRYLLRAGGAAEGGDDSCGDGEADSAQDATLSSVVHTFEASALPVQCRRIACSYPSPFICLHSLSPLRLSRRRSGPRRVSSASTRCPRRETCRTTCSI